MSERPVSPDGILALEALQAVTGGSCALLSESGATRWGTLPPAVVASEVIAVEHRRWMPAGSGVVFVARVGTADRPLWVCTSFDELADGARDDVAARIEAVGLSVFEAHRLRDDFERMRLMFQSVLDTIPVRVFWKDLEGRYLGSNQLFAEDAAHDSPADLLGKNDYDMPWAPEAELYRADDRAVTKSGDAKVDYEEPQTTPSGTMLWLQTSKIPLRDPEGQTFGVLGTYADITPRKLAEQAREELLAELERKNVELERFTYTVSHDLKGPVVTIRGFAGLLREELTGAGSLDEVRPALEHAASRIERAGSGMARMLEELLEMSRAGNVLGSREPRPLREVLDDATLHCSGAIAESGATLRVAPELPVVVVDGARMVQVFQNLIENACKYRSPERALTITVEADDDGSIRVSDNGIGIPEPQREMVFRPFRKLVPSTPGSGIGLALVQRIVEAHGSQVRISDGPEGVGTTFSFQLAVATNGAT